jgi:serine O-acetyltransferase
MNTLTAIKADTHRQYGYFSWQVLIRDALLNRTFRVILTMRLCQAVANGRGLMPLLLPFFALLHRITTNLAGIDFPWQAQVGDGLALNHGWGMVISPGARIGNNVTLLHGVTLGRRDRISTEGKRLTEYPVIENEVWVGPNAVIVGGVTIGRGSRIAGGAFIVESVPPYSVVSGNPATIVKSNCVPDVLNPAPL